MSCDSESGTRLWVQHLSSQILCLAPFDVVPEIGYLIYNDQNHRRKALVYQEAVDEIAMLMGMDSTMGSKSGNAERDQVFNLVEVLHAELHCVRSDLHWNQFRLEVLANQKEHARFHTAWLLRLARQWTAGHRVVDVEFPSNRAL